MKNLHKRLLAFMLALVLCFSGLMLPEKAEAAGSTSFTLEKNENKIINISGYESVVFNFS